MNSEDPIQGIVGFQPYAAALQDHLTSLRSSIFFNIRAEGGPHPRQWACTSECNTHFCKAIRNTQELRTQVDCRVGFFSDPLHLFVFCLVRLYCAPGGPAASANTMVLEFALLCSHHSTYTAHTHQDTYAAHMHLSNCTAL